MNHEAVHRITIDIPLDWKHALKRKNDSRRVAFVMLLACFVLTAGCKDEAPQTVTQPDVYILLVDTLRADHLGLYGYERPSSPRLDEFARSSVVFDKVFAAAPWTLPAVGSIMTGLYPSARGLRAKAQAEGMMELRPGVSTLAETFQNQGYRTAAVMTNPWLTGGQHGVERGFESYTSIHNENAEVVNQWAKRLIEDTDPRPLFLYLHYMDPHGPYDRHTKDRDAALGPLPRRFDRALTAAEEKAVPEYMRLSQIKDLGTYVQAYDRTIRHWDESFGDFIDWLDRPSDADEPVIVVIADHGEEFVEHEGWSHGETLYEEQLFVPWLMRFPDRTPRRIDDRVVSQIDMAPTLLSALDIPVPDSMQGENVLSADLAAGRPVFAETDVRTGGFVASEFVQRAVRRGDDKEIFGPAGVECFDLGKDAGEERSDCESAERRERASRDLREWMDDNAARAKALGEGAVVELDAEQTERLRAIGYVD